MGTSTVALRTTSRPACSTSPGSAGRHPREHADAAHPLHARRRADRRRHLLGDKWNPIAGTGLCTTEAWKAQPGYRQFSVIARWVLDPADPANFTRKLATRKFLIQEVVGDQVVPNVATENEGALVGFDAAGSRTRRSASHRRRPPSQRSRRCRTSSRALPDATRRCGRRFPGKRSRTARCSARANTPARWPARHRPHADRRHSPSCQPVSRP